MLNTWRKYRDIMVKHSTKGRLGLVLVILIMLSACSATPKAVFIIVDGIPADVIESVDTPNLDVISNAGGYTRAYTGGEVGGESETPTVSAVGYNSLLTGTWANKHNVYGNGVEAPDYAYWDIFRVAEAHDPSLQTAVFSTWLDNRTKLLGDGIEAAGGVNKIDYHFDGFELDEERFPHDEEQLYIRAIDELVSNEAARHIDMVGADLNWVYLEYTDATGHKYGDSPQLTEAVELADDQVGRIWNAVCRRQAETGEDWLIVITTDHGRDAETGKGHGGQSTRERTIWIVTNSGRLNERFYETPAMVDIMPSIAVHMTLSMPADIRAQLDGESFISRK